MEEVATDQRQFYITARGAGIVKTECITARTPVAALQKFKKFYPEYVIKYDVSEKE